MTRRADDVEMQPLLADRFLVEAAGILASSLEYENTLAALAQLAVRSLADFCIIDLLEADGEIRRVQVAHADPDQAGITAELLRFPIDRQRPHMSLRVLQTGEPVLAPDVTADVLDAVAQDDEHLRILQALRPRSYMAVPLLAHHRLVGVVLFVSSHRAYSADDLEIAEKLALLAGLEVDNARHYREARQALEARDRVLGAVAHDLRNPLNTIVMTVSLLRDMALSESERRARTDVILLAADRMNRLIEDLLDVARIGGNHFLLECDDYPAAPIAQEAVELCRLRAAAKSQQLVLDAAAGAPVIHADRERLLRVLTNLLDNAVRFTPEGGSIRVVVDESAGSARFTVADTGPGIAAEDLPHLFRPFWQAGSGSGGAGLGLAIALGLVEAHGGTMWVESAPGHGSAFHFTVPLGRNR